MEDIAKIMQACGHSAVNHARHRHVELDYTEASLEAVDLVLASITPDGCFAPRTQEEESDLWTLSKAYGAYVGEVVIRELGGRWTLQALPGGGAQAVLVTHGIQAFPCEKVYQRLTEDELSAMGGYCRALRKIMELQASRETSSPGSNEA